MAPQELQHARHELEDAVPVAEDDVRKALRETASSFASLEAADREPDHAVFDGHLNTLRQARERADGDVADRIGRALEHAESYRETLEQA